MTFNWRDGQTGHGLLQVDCRVEWDNAEGELSAVATRDMVNVGKSVYSTVPEIDKSDIARLCNLFLQKRLQHHRRHVIVGEDKVIHL